MRNNNIHAHCMLHQFQRTIIFYPTNKNCYTGPNSPHPCKYLLVSDNTVAESIYSTTGPRSVKPIPQPYPRSAVRRYLSSPVYI